MGELYCLYFLSLLFCRCMQFVGCVVDICEDETFNFEIGKKFTILDIDANSISALSKTCYKSLKLPGIENATLSVDRARFSADKYWTYNSNVGTLIKMYYDKAFIHFGQCASNTLKKSELRFGLVQNFNSTELCIIFEPETEFKPLGGHVAGGRIQLTVRVNVARCKIDSETTKSGSEHGCYDLCSADGVVQTCVRQPANTTSTIQSTVSPIVGRKSTIANIIGTQLATTTATTKIETRSPFMSYHSVFTTHDLLTPTTHYTSKSSSFMRSTSIPSIDNRSSVASTTRLSIQTVSMSTSESFSNSEAATTTARITHELTPEEPHAPNDGSGNWEILGFRRSLYIFTGCGMLVLTIFSVTCCVVCRKQRCFCQKGFNSAVSVISSDTFTTNKEMMWRHNWLARYHDNQAFNRAESEIDYDQLNHELFVDIARRQCRNSQKSDATDPYDNPWPLARLGSDFVRGTKRLDRTSSDDNFTSSDHVESVSYQSIDSNGDSKETIEEDMAYQKENSKTNTHECTYKTAQMNICCTNPEYQNSLKRTKSTNQTRHSQSNARLQRVGNVPSTPDKNLHTKPEQRRSSSRSDSSASSVHVQRVRTSSVKSNKSKISNARRERNPSSVCSSDCSVRLEELVPEFDEETLKQRYPDEVYVQTGNNSGSPEKRGLTLKNALSLYTIVSHRDRASHPCGPCGTMQFPK